MAVTHGDGLASPNLHNAPPLASDQTHSLRGAAQWVLEATDAFQIHCRVYHIHRDPMKNKIELDLHKFIRTADFLY